MNYKLIFDHKKSSKVLQLHNVVFTRVLQKQLIKSIQVKMYIYLCVQQRLANGSLCRMTIGI